MTYETVSVQICEVFAGESHDCPGHILLEASLHHEIKVIFFIVTFYLTILTWYEKKYMNSGLWESRISEREKSEL